MLYLGGDEDEFGAQREMLNGHLMPSMALKLTHIDVYGVNWAYVMGTGGFGLSPFSSILILTTTWKCQGLITPWRLFDDGLSSTGDYSHVTALSLRLVIGPLIDHYRRLGWPVTLSGEVDFSSPLFADAPLDPVTGEAQPPTNRDADNTTK